MYQQSVIRCTNIHVEVEVKDGIKSQTAVGCLETGPCNFVSI